MPRLFSFPKPKYDYISGRKISKRKVFKISTKKKEWNMAAGRNIDDFKQTSKCRKCKRNLSWRDGSYDFDHKDNNSANNSQGNCYLVCKSCHGKATKIDKRKVIPRFGGPIRYETIKKKVGYKKQTKKKITKKKRSRRKPSIWGGGIPGLLNMI